MAAAAVREIRRRKRLLSKLEHRDESVSIAALQTFEAASAAAEWHRSSPFWLGGAIPAQISETKLGRQRVVQLLGRIGHVDHTIQALAEDGFNQPFCVRIFPSSARCYGVLLFPKGRHTW